MNNDNVSKMKYQKLILKIILIIGAVCLLNYDPVCAGSDNLFDDSYAVSKDDFSSKFDSAYADEVFGSGYEYDAEWNPQSDSSDEGWEGYMAPDAFAADTADMPNGEEHIMSSQACIFADGPKLDEDMSDEDLIKSLTAIANGEKPSNSPSSPEVEESKYNKIMKWGEPENGLYWHPVTGYEYPVNPNYDLMIGQNFKSAVTPDTMPFKYIEIPVEGSGARRDVPLFFSSDYIGASEKKVAGFYQPAFDSIIVGNENIKSNNYDRLGKYISGSDYAAETKQLAMDILNESTQGLDGRDKATVSRKGTVRHELFHALIHSDAAQMVQNDVVPEGVALYEKYPINTLIVSEVGGYLGAMATSETPKVDFLRIQIFGKELHGVSELFAADSIKDMMMKKLGGVEYVTQKAIQEKANEQDGYISDDDKADIVRTFKKYYDENRFVGEKAMAYELEFIKGRSDDEIRKAAGEEFERIFKQPPLPPDIIKDIPEDYYLPISKSASDKE